MFHSAPREVAPQAIHRASAEGLVKQHSLRKGAGGGHRYPYRLNFYAIPPVDEITLEQFENWALDRLRVLATIETSAIRNVSQEQTRAAFKNITDKYMPLSTNSVHKDTDSERKKDHVSHFVCRLAFCRSEDLRHRFARAETQLFRLRFDTDSISDRNEFLASMNFGWTPVESSEKNMYKHELKAAATYLGKKWDFEREAYWKVPWTVVLDLVERRRVFLNGGMAYVPSVEQMSLVLQEFSKRLMKDLEMTANNLGRISLGEDLRLVPLLEHLSLGFIAGVSDSYVSNPNLVVGVLGGSVHAADVDNLTAHFPLCMKHLHSTLKREKHLKHYGRLQFNLFLKGVGLPVEEALVFWRRSFSAINDDKFNKEYRYNIRHNYGLEGGRRDYQPKSCQQILTQDQPGPQDSHGCPFRTFSEQALRFALPNHCDITDSSAQKEILDAVKAGHFHVACTRVFELTHHRSKGEGLGSGESVVHPNAYFEQSVKLKAEAGSEPNGLSAKKET